MDGSQDSLARTIGGVLWKGYEDLMSTMSSTKKDSGKSIPGQIPSSLSNWENDLIKRKSNTEDRNV